MFLWQRFGLFFGLEASWAIVFHALGGGVARALNPVCPARGRRSSSAATLVRRARAGRFPSERGSYENSFFSRT
jgi:hypothetical protein